VELRHSHGAALCGVCAIRLELVLCSRERTDLNRYFHLGESWTNNVHVHFRCGEVPSEVGRCLSLMDPGFSAMPGDHDFRVEISCGIDVSDNGCD